MALSFIGGGNQSNRRKPPTLTLPLRLTCLLLECVDKLDSLSYSFTSISFFLLIHCIIYKEVCTANTWSNKAFSTLLKDTVESWIYWKAWVRFMVFNATFNNISVILWQSVLLWIQWKSIIQSISKLSSSCQQWYFFI
jgi:hypothetical protein